MSFISMEKHKCYIVFAKKITNLVDSLVVELFEVQKSILVWRFEAYFGML